MAEDSSTAPPPPQPAAETPPPPSSSPAPPEEDRPPAPTTEQVTEKDKEEPLAEQLQPQPSQAAAENKSLAAAMDKEEREVAAVAAEKPEKREEEAVAAASATVEDDDDDDDKKRKMIPENLVSFKEESNRLVDLSDSERKSLDELKTLVREALDNRQLEQNQPEEEVSIWGIPLLKDERSDVILLKFLRARDFKARDSFNMLKNTIKWRREFKIEELVEEEEDLGGDLDKVVFMHGHDKEGHPVCYNVYGEFQNKELYEKTFSDEEKRMRFLRGRIQFLERSVRKLDFSPGGVSTIFQVNDLKNSPGPGKKELRLATKQAVQLLQDNYPEFVAKQVFINVPWWYLAFYTMLSPFMTQRSKSKLVFAGPARSPETLFKYISPEQVPIQYGGLSVDLCECNPEFTMDDPATELTVKPGTKQTVEIIIYEKCVLVWEIRVVGWEVSYKAEFVPDAQDAYTVIIQKPRKMAPTGIPVVSHSFKVAELGKVLLTVDNPTTKKKKLVYRFNVKPFSD